MESQNAENGTFCEIVTGSVLYERKVFPNFQVASENHFEGYLCGGVMTGGKGGDASGVIVGGAGGTISSITPLVPPWQPSRGLFTEKGAPFFMGNLSLFRVCVAVSSKARN